MAGEWETTLLRDLLVTTKDGDWGKENPEDGYVPYHIIRGTDFPDVRVGDLSSVPLRYLPEHTVKRRTLEPDDILIETAGGTRDRPTGRTLLITEKVLSRFRGPVTCASFARFLRIDRKQAYPRFVFWYLQHLYDKGEMSQHQVQHTGVARFQYTRFAETQNVPLPPLAEQKAIAAVLGALDDKIELNRRMNATLEAMARALFQSWFVDFDPVRAKLDGRPPTALDPATAALFPDSFQDSELGHIPKGWKAGTVAEGFNLTMGQSPPGDTYNEEGNGLPFYQGRTDFGFRFPTRRMFCTAPTRYAKPGDTLVSVRAPVGDINMADEECCIGRGVAAVRHKSGATSFTYHAMANLYPDFAAYEAEGTVFGSINKQNFENLRFVIAPPEVVAEYERQAGPLDEQIRTLEHQSRTLATLRDTLLPKLLSGELSVAEFAAS
jgi:type I restriction enzyme S subunit